MRACYEAVVFDLDGTLLDSYGAIHDCLNHVLEAFRRPTVTEEETRRMVGHGLDALMRGAVGDDACADAVALFRERYAVVGPGATTLMPWADEVTGALSAGGIPMAGASNKPAEFSRQLLDELGLLSRFSAVAGPGDGIPPKPDPEMVLRLVRALGFPPGAVLMAGDMDVDVETARRAGIAAAVVPGGSCSREELSRSGPDHLLDDLRGLLPLFGIRAPGE